ncbi:MAG: hypothetical protein KQH57_01675 [Actinomycetales bacterium]|nr:hypothetical protein [Actinomycetales bacterium]
MTPVPRRPRRAGDLVRVLVGLVVVGHGLVHLIGVVPQAAEAPIPDPGTAGRALWLLAALAVVAAGVGLVAGRRRWWYVGAPAVVVSLAAVLTAWPAAAAGTVANAVLAVAVVHGWLAEGPRSRRERYRRHQSAVIAEAPDPAEPIAEADLALLPPLVAGYLRRAGAVGRPRAAAFRAVLSGRIRSAPGAPWMAFVAEQVNTVGAHVTRWFRMDATMLGLPVDVLHVYDDGVATMSAAACSAIRVARMSGAEAGHAETVTVLNDVCVLAPWALVGLPVDWEPVDDHRVRARYTCGQHQVSAVLVFDDAGDLVDFVSDDRARIDGASSERLTWSTPVGERRELGAGRVPTVGSAWWHAQEGAYPYIEMRIHDVAAIGAGEGSGDRPGSRLSARGRS